MSGKNCYEKESKHFDADLCKVTKYLSQYRLKLSNI